MALGCGPPGAVAAAARRGSRRPRAGRGPGAERARRRADAPPRLGEAGRAARRGGESGGGGGGRARGECPRGGSHPRRPPECSPAAGARGTTTAVGGDICPDEAAPAGPAPADAATRCRWSVGGRARPRAVPGALPAHTCPRGVGDGGRWPRNGSPAVGGTHVGPCWTYGDTCLAGVAIAWRGTAWRSRPRPDPLQRDGELSQPPSGALNSHPAPPLSPAWRPSRRLDRKHLPGGKALGKIEWGANGRSRALSLTPIAFFGGGELSGFICGRFYLWRAWKQQHRPVGGLCELRCPQPCLQSQFTRLRGTGGGTGRADSPGASGLAGAARFLWQHGGARGGPSKLSHEQGVGTLSEDRKRSIQGPEDPLPVVSRQSPPPPLFSVLHLSSPLQLAGCDGGPQGCLSSWGSCSPPHLG